MNRSHPFRLALLIGSLDIHCSHIAALPLPSIAFSAPSERIESTRYIHTRLVGQLLLETYSQFCIFILPTSLVLPNVTVLLKRPLTDGCHLLSTIIVAVFTVRHVVQWRHLLNRLEEGVRQFATPAS